jgi:hypothetical protein
VKIKGFSLLMVVVVFWEALLALFGPLYQPLLKVLIVTISATLAQPCAHPFLGINLLHGPPLGFLSALPRMLAQQYRSDLPGFLAVSTGP